MKISTLASHEGFGIAQSSGLEVGGVQFTIYMTTITTAIDFFKTFTSTSDAQQTKFVNFRSTTDAQIGTFNNFNSTGDANDLSFWAFTSTSDAQQTKFVNFRTTTDVGLDARGDAFGNPSSTMIIRAPFGIYSSSGVFDSSVTIRTIIISTGGALLGNTTIQATLTIEGGSVTISNPGATAFTFNYASAPAAGQKLGVTGVAGNRVTIGGVGDLDTTGSGGGSDNLGSHVSTRPITLSDGLSVVTGTSIVIGTQPFNGARIAVSTTPDTTKPIVVFGTGTPIYEFWPSTFIVGAATSYFQTVIAGSEPVTGVIIDRSSVTINGDTGVAGGLSASTYTVRGYALASTTVAATSRLYDGYVFRWTTGTIVGNTEVTLSASQFIPGATAIAMPLCSELEINAVATSGIKISGVSNLPTSFNVKNGNVATTQGYACGAWVRPP